jgi:Phosphodiester glycosidase
MSAVSFRAAPVITALIVALAFLGGELASTGTRSPAFAQVTGAPAFVQPSNWPRVRSAAVNAETLGPGVRYERWQLATDAGPLVVSIATIDLRDPFVGLAVATHGDVIIGKDERLSSMADRIGAELGINADYFDISESGSPLNLVARDGRILHQPDRAATFVMDGQGNIQMGAYAWQMHIAGPSGAALDVSAVNEWSPSVDLALVTPELGAANPAGATEMVLSPATEPGTYRVTRVDPDLGAFDALAPGELGIVARGAQALALTREFHLADALTITEQSDPQLQSVRLGIGGGPLLVRDGQPVADAAAPAPEETDVRNPVTGAGLSSDGATLWFVVVDGRKPAFSIGLTRPQLAALFIALGSTTAMAFDSGGSSEMVVRHAGDLTSSVANAPSDGRERSVADGLFVLNTAARGPISALILKAPASQVLVGSTLGIDVRAVDANDQPLVVDVAGVTFSTDPATVATIDRTGTLKALSPGSVQVDVAARGAQARTVIGVVPAVDELYISPANPAVATSAKIQLSATATMKDGSTVAVDATTILWRQTGDGGRVQPDGVFVAGPVPARTIVTAQAGGASGSVTILSGDHAVMLQAVPQAGGSLGAWHYAARPADVPGGVDGTPAPDGSAALRLAYDFSATQTTRAAYAQTELTLPGQPIALAVDVYGDRNFEWLRAGYRNADGNDESLTVARHVDWQGWKSIRVQIPEQSSWPIVLTRLYAVERSKDMREQGSLWFRNLQLFFAGPP